ncbi:hypothetical protein Ancab_038187 [Ancistrocladus abbreviatus]
MYNYFRWFPGGKIVFAAPSRPLVMQQIEACHNIVGIPQEWTIDMTGQTSPTKRACLWKAKRVFFVTPQVLEKDIQSGACLVKYLVCLVIDEAHRAMGNYSYCVAVRELMAVPVQLRILALTATPGSKQQTIQHVIDNLKISTLEYRNENDHDVSPYVHNRKIELMEVPMGQNAIEINNLLLDVIRPIAARLCTMGVLQNRDFQTLSPCDLLNSRDKFRQAPPPELSHMKYGEVEGYFGVLITLYHIRKLLSSHGIRPAYEMLEEKLLQGSFARLMSRNEVLRRAKLLMQQSVLHGAPSPKLSKMIEVLLDHFRTNDPQNSRVIIFSNFRGSVRDIMETLANIGDFVKATQFVGQSSGKTLKGQSQKVQQAVLEKFRRGGYNVIVATSIGEEGLDIMEVDLVICFDANISPLRMIQRMGRTGRKHDGRVVVLACQGTELKGYMRKQATGKVVRKHMRNGGMNSFTFHPSPRMVPHVYKPELQFLELSIEEFVPRGRKLKDDSVEAPFIIEKLNESEAVVLAKFFQDDENSWKPSLIAFPSFQEFPSRVHGVMHSSRTGMLIDTMQLLRGLSFSWSTKISDVESLASKSQDTAVGAAEHVESREEPLANAANSSYLVLDKKVSVYEDKYKTPNPFYKELGTLMPPPDASMCTENYDRQDSPDKVLDTLVNPPCTSLRKKCDLRCGAVPQHSYLFGSDIASVDNSGKVLVSSPPLLALDEISYSKSLEESNTTLLRFSSTKTSCGEFQELSMKNDSVAAPVASDCDRCKSPEGELRSVLPIDAQAVGLLDEADGDDCLLQIPLFKGKHASQRIGCDETAQEMIYESPALPAEFNDDIGDIDLSPRLTNFIKSGFVPESPLHNTGFPNTEERDEMLVVQPTSPPNAVMLGNSSNFDNELPIVTVDPHSIDCRAPLVNNVTRTPVLKPGGLSDLPAAQGFGTPLGDFSNSSCSKEWCMSSGERSESAGQTRKFKRLRRIGDSVKERVCQSKKENTAGLCSKLSMKAVDAVPNLIKPRRGKDLFRDAQDLIEEEAEVSSEVEVSDDEEDDENDDTYEDSFIDDRLNPSATSCEAEDGRINMMAIYRRSLLSQSPIQRPQNSPESVASKAWITESGGCSRKTTRCPQTPLANSESANISVGMNSELSQSKMDRIPFEAMPSTSGRTEENEANMQNRKRKYLSLPVVNLEKEFLVDSATGHVSSLPDETSEDDRLADDQFFEGLDLNQLEALAAKLLSQKAAGTSVERERTPEPTLENGSLLSSPSFDLGIS